MGPEKFREFTYLKTPKKKYEPLSLATGNSGTEKSTLKFTKNEIDLMDIREDMLLSKQELKNALKGKPTSSDPYWNVQFEEFSIDKENIETCRSITQ